MKRSRIARLIATLCLAVMLAGCGGGAAGTSTSPTANGAPVATSAAPAAGQAPAMTGPPSAPKSAAPASSALFSRPTDTEVPSGSATLDLPSGWSIVSFPFARVDATSGLTHLVYTWRDGAWAEVDAGANPDALDTRLGWFVYLDAPGRITVTGTVQTADEVALPLQPGWNLVGNPFDRALSWSWARVSEGDATRTLEAAVNSGDPLLGRQVYGLREGASFHESLPTSTIEANGGRWVFALHACDLNLSAAAPPTAAATANAGASGTVTGQVQSSTGKNLAGARVTLDSGQSATTLSNGTFTITNVPAGVRTVTISLTGYTTGRGTITVYAGQTRTVYVSLTPTTPPPSTGTFYVRAYAWTYGGKRYWVSKIEVNEYANYSVRWSKSWWSDLGYSAFDLSCTGAVVGRYFTIKVTWQNSAGTTYSTTRYRTFSSAGQTEYVYSP